MQEDPKVIFGRMIANREISEKVSLAFDISSEGEEILCLVAKSYSQLDDVMKLVKGKIKAKDFSLVLERYPELALVRYVVLPDFGPLPLTSENPRNAVGKRVVQGKEARLIDHRVFREVDENEKIDAFRIRHNDPLPQDTIETFCVEERNGRTIDILTMKMRLCDLSSNIISVSVLLAKLSKQDLSPPTTLYR